MDETPDPWQLSDHQKVEAVKALSMIVEAIKTDPQNICAYKGKIDGREVVVLGFLIDKLGTARPLAVIGDAFLNDVEAEGGKPVWVDPQ